MIWCFVSAFYHFLFSIGTELHMPRIYAESWCSYRNDSTRKCIIQIEGNSAKIQNVIINALFLFLEI